MERKVPYLKDALPMRASSPEMRENLEDTCTAVITAAQSGNREAVMNMLILLLESARHFRPAPTLVQSGKPFMALSVPVATVELISAEDGTKRYVMKNVEEGAPGHLAHVAGLVTSLNRYMQDNETPFLAPDGTQRVLSEMSPSELLTTLQEIVSMQINGLCTIQAIDVQ